MCQNEIIKILKDLDTATAQDIGRLCSLSYHTVGIQIRKLVKKRRVARKSFEADKRVFVYYLL